MSQENYGQILQMYALSSYLKALGHKVFIVQYNGYADKSLDKSASTRLFNLLRNPLKIITYIKSRIREKVIQKDLQLHDCGFSSFKREHFEWSTLYNSYDLLKNSPPEADIFICGSDMIWAESNRCAPYFLDFVKNSKKVAYAPSFGSKDVSNAYKKTISVYLNDFSLITTREESGVEICNQLGFSASWVVDPTGLLDTADYIKLEHPLEIEGKYIFMYLLGHETYIPFSDIKKFADTINFSVVYRAAPGRRDKLPKSYPSINQWLYAIHHAEYIITNSFHGCMFCILYKKKFLYLPLIKNSKSSNERIYSLLKRLNLSSRIYEGNFNTIYDEIDYNRVTGLLEKWVKESKHILKSSLTL